MPVHLLLLLIAVLLLSWAPPCPSETFATHQGAGFIFHYRIKAEAGKEECFGQYITPGATVFIAFHVLSGGDEKAGFTIRNPSGVYVMPYVYNKSADYEEQSASTGGFYLLCIDNSQSSFSSKLVNLFVNAYKRDKWEVYSKELEEEEMAATNFTVILQAVDGRIGEMLKYQDQSRNKESKDWFLVDSNHTYIQRWSIAQCVVIFLTSTLQVYFLKKLFDVKNVTPTSKPRA